MEFDTTDTPVPESYIDYCPLHAAAPDLLVALEEVRAALPREIANGGWWNRVDAAITKAKAKETT